MYDTQEIAIALARSIANSCTCKNKNTRREESRKGAPMKNPIATTEPRKTLFVARINYDTSEAKLRREFEMYGQIRKIVMVHDLNNKPRGYAFIEYVHERDMHCDML
ncbi:UNVERIFIED_CONTAM: snRNP-U1-70K [Trichonephila clavipes]